MRKLALAMAMAALSATVAQGQSYPLGKGTDGTGGFVPFHSANGPWLGNVNFRLKVDRAYGGSVAFLLLSSQGAQLAFAGGILYTDLAPPNPILFLPIPLSGPAGVPGAGSGALALPLPQIPTLIGFTVFTQMVIDETFGGGPKLVLSNALIHDFIDVPELFVGTSILNNDPYHFINPANGAILETGQSVETDNCQGALYTHGGANLFVASSIQDTIGHAANPGVHPVSFNTIYNATSGCYGLGYNRLFDLVWTLTDPGTTGQIELVAINGNPMTGSFGSLAHTTNGLAGGITFIEPWGMSPGGRHAAVTSFIPIQLFLVDTNPQSQTFRQVIFTGPAPSSGAFALANEVRITPDDEWVLMLITDIDANGGQIARFHIPTLTWYDHNPSMPGIQHLGNLASPAVNFLKSPSVLEVSSDASFAIVGGWEGCGWLGRLDFDVTDPSAWNFTPWSVPNVPHARGALSNDDSTVAITSWAASSCSGSPTVRFFDTTAGAHLLSTTLPLNSNSAVNQNLYTVEWR